VHRVRGSVATTPAGGQGRIGWTKWSITAITAVLWTPVVPSPDSRLTLRSRLCVGLGVERPRQWALAHSSRSAIAQWFPSTLRADVTAIVWFTSNASRHSIAPGRPGLCEAFGHAFRNTQGRNAARGTCALTRLRCGECSRSRTARSSMPLAPSTCGIPSPKAIDLAFVVTQPVQFVAPPRGLTR
jgi:hypothetical protein